MTESMFYILPQRSIIHHETNNPLNLSNSVTISKDTERDPTCFLKHNAQAYIKYS